MESEYYKKMSEDEYYDKLREISKPFDCIPNIRDFIISYSYEHGHSAGREEVLNIAQSLAYDLKEALIKDGIIDKNGDRRNYFPSM